MGYMRKGAGDIRVSKCLCDAVCSEGILGCLNDESESSDGPEEMGE